MTRGLAALRRRARAAHEDRGFTLTELLVAMSVFAIVVTLSTAAMIKLMSVAHDSSARADAQFDARSGLDDIDKQMRSGNVLFSPKNEGTFVHSCVAASDGSDAGSCMRIYTQTNGVPRCVQWQVLSQGVGSGRAILRTRNWSPDWQTNADVSGWRTVARDMTLGTTMPFQLVRDSAAIGTDPYDRRLLRVYLLAHDDVKKNDIALTTSLSGRNTSYGYDTGQCTPVPAE